MQFCAFGVDGQVEGRGTGEDEGRRKPEGSPVLGVTAGLQQVHVADGEVQQQGRGVVPG